MRAARSTHQPNTLQLTLPRAAYLTPEGTGYAQQGFQLPCAACGFAIDRPALAMDKFARDLVKEYAGDGAKLGAYLPCVRAYNIRGSLCELPDERIGIISLEGRCGPRRTWSSSSARRS